MNGIHEISQRIRAMRELCGITPAEMAEATGLTEDQYFNCEEGSVDFPFSFISKCADRFGIDAVELITGENPRLKGYVVTHDGMGLPVQRWSGYDYRHLAPYFADKAADPFLVRAPYVEEYQEGEIHTEAHEGQEFDYVISGSLRFVHDGHEENLIAGDSVYFDATKPHGMAATSKDGCEYIVVIMRGGKSRWSGTSTCATSTRRTMRTGC